MLLTDFIGLPGPGLNLEPGFPWEDMCLLVFPHLQWEEEVCSLVGSNRDLFSHLTLENYDEALELWKLKVLWVTMAVVLASALVFSHSTEQGLLSGTQRKLCYSMEIFAEGQTKNFVT